MTLLLSCLCIPHALHSSSPLLPQSKHAKHCFAGHVQSSSERRPLLITDWRTSLNTDASCILLELTKHAGSRDKKAFTSHAQKHFIKLCIADAPLPEKVIATGLGDGMGYTLSGLPLDPHSSSAKSYGFKPEHLTSKSLTPKMTIL